MGQRVGRRPKEGSLSASLSGPGYSGPWEENGLGSHTLTPPSSSYSPWLHVKEHVARGGAGTREPASSRWAKQGNPQLGEGLGIDRR